MSEADPLQALRAARARGLKTLDEPSGKALLAWFGLRVPAFRVVNCAQDLASIGTALHPPYVLKAVSTQVVHKSDIGAVKLGLQTLAEVARHMEGMRASLAGNGIEPESWLVEEMAAPGLECVVGGVMDPEFGPMVMVGVGGIFVELLADVSFRICPIGRADALDMLEELRTAALLRGARGREPASLEALVDALLKVGGEGGVLLRCEAEVSELDVNPLIVSRDSAIAVDTRFILRPS